MTSPHTLEHMRDEYFNGNGLTDRKSRQKWEKEGSLNTRERAREIAQKLLGEEERSYVPEDVDKVIRKKYGILL